MDKDSFVFVKDANVGSRKKKKTARVKEQKKLKRYTAPAGSNLFQPCLHKNKSIKCIEVKPRDALNIRKILYEVANKTIQDNMISGWLTLKNVQRRRSRPINTTQGRPKPHNFTVKYSVINSRGMVLPVCKKFFMHLTRIKATRLNSIAKSIKAGKNLKERRGGDHVSQKSARKKESVQQFVGNLQGRESHYNRKKSKRIYLHSDLTINKLCNTYNDSVALELQVSKSMFRRVFNGFNIGFCSPASDVCSFCTKIDIQLKNEKSLASRNIVQINDLIMQKRIHKKRAQAFYELLREQQENEVTYCFDLQQVQPLPKSCIQEAFYKRQISFYAFCIVDANAKNPCFYTWTEDLAGRGSTEVSSALLHFLKSVDLRAVKRIKLFCDGCGGQNKNNIVIHTLMHFLGTTNSNVEEVEITFPVRGHSFLPADRIFGRIEKLLRKKPNITTKEEYYDVYETVGPVRKLGEDWPLMDTKSLSVRFKNVDHISEKKRIFIKREEIMKNNHSLRVITVRSLQYFRFESESEVFEQLLKRGWSMRKCFSVPIEQLPLGHPISVAKKNDVDSLLKIIYGEHWENENLLAWYKTVLRSEAECAEDLADENSEKCDCLEEDCGLHI